MKLRDIYLIVTGAAIVNSLVLLMLSASVSPPLDSVALIIGGLDAVVAIVALVKHSLADKEAMVYIE